MDEICIEGLKIEALIGCYEWEQHTPQTIILDLSLFCDTQKAAQTDNLEHALDYAAIANAVISRVQSKHFQLIEALAESLAGWLLELPLCAAVEVSISKPNAIAQASNTRLKIRRSSTPIAN